MSTHTLPVADGPAVYVIHDNPEWIPPFADAFADLGVELVEWLLPGAAIDLAAAPPEGVFWSRLSASSHTRTDPHVKEYGRAVLAWLEAAGRTVVNGSQVLELEVSKIRQHRVLAARGIDVPATSAAFGSAAIAEVASGFAPPFITKHNQGGKGLGVRRFDSHAELEAAVADFAPGGSTEPIDGITLVQEYLQPAAPFITRAEFVGGRFHYAVAVDVSAGSFELCPADACAVPGTAGSLGDSQFTRRDEITADTPLIGRLEALLTELGIDFAGVEFIDTADGRQVVYDINTNTNYNAEVEAGERAAGRQPAAVRLAEVLGAKLEAAYHDAAVAAPVG